MKNGNRRRRGAAFAAILSVLAAALPAVFLNTVFGWLPLLMLILAAVGSAISRRLLCAGLTAEAPETALRCVRGNSQDFSVTVKNHTPLFCWRAEAVFVRREPGSGEEAYTTAPLTLRPGESRRFDFSVTFAHIGLCAAGLAEIRVYGLFGLARSRATVGKLRKIEVLPRVYPLSRLPVSGKVLSESRRALVRSAAEEQDYAGVREYALGDPIKSIHWKLSAHASGFYTKLMESCGVPGVSILADMALPADDPDTRLDCVCEAAASLCRFAREAGMEYELCFRNASGFAERYIPDGDDDYAPLLEAVLSGGSREGLCPLLREETAYLYGRANLMLCTASLTRELAQAMLEARELGRNPVLFLACGDGEQAETTALLKLLQGAGIPYYLLRRPEDLEKML